MSFRQEVRCKVLAARAGPNSDLGTVVHAPPKSSDALDVEILQLAATHTAGSQFKAFWIRYQGNEENEQDRKAMEFAYSVRIAGEEPDAVFGFDVIARNSLRAFKRIIDVVKAKGSRKTNLEGRDDARDDT